MAQPQPTGPEMIRFGMDNASQIKSTYIEIDRHTRGALLHLMNDTANQVLADGERDQGYCDPELFMTTFFGGFFDENENWSSEVENRSLATRVEKDIRLDAAVGLARTVPSATGDIYTCSDDIDPFGFDNVGLVLRDDPSVSSRQVRYSISRRSHPDRVTGTVSFSGLFKLDEQFESGTHAIRQTPILEVTRTMISSETTVIDTPHVALGLLAVRQATGLNGRYGSERMNELEAHRQGLLEYAQRIGSI